MKEKRYYLLVILLLSIFTYGCNINNNHKHEYINGACSCGSIVSTNYSVVLYNDNNIYLEKEVYNNGILGEIEEPIKEGFEFLGWYKGDEVFDVAKDSVTSDLELHAKWEKLEYSVFIKNKNEIVNTYKFNYNEEIKFELELDVDYAVVSSISEYPVVMPKNDIEINIECYDIREVFVLSDDGFGIKSYLGNDVNIIIPSAYYMDGKIVNITRIEPFAFENNKILESIELPDSINKIGREAFSNCWNLKYVNIPYGVETIDYKTFNGTSIENIEIPESVTVIVNSAFSNCEEIKEVVIPNSVIEIGDSVFINCNKMEKISIPFTGNKLVDPTNTYFGYIFGDYRYNKGFSSNIPMSLKEVILTNTVNIYEKAFEGVKYVHEFKLQDGVETIGAWAFSECLNLRRIEMPSTLKRIYKCAYSSCNEVTEVILKDGLERIDNNVFGCKKLGSIVIPDSVEIMGSSIFSCEYMTIYCEVESKPNSWETTWNLIYGANYIDVVWGYSK